MHDKCIIKAFCPNWFVKKLWGFRWRNLWKNPFSLMSFIKNFFFITRHRNWTVSRRYITKGCRRFPKWSAKNNSITCMHALHELTSPLWFVLLWITQNALWKLSFELNNFSRKFESILRIFAFQACDWWNLLRGCAVSLHVWMFVWFYFILIIVVTIIIKMGCLLARNHYPEVIVA